MHHRVIRPLRRRSIPGLGTGAAAGGAGHRGIPPAPRQTDVTPYAVAGPRMRVRAPRRPAHRPHLGPPVRSGCAQAPCPPTQPGQRSQWIWPCRQQSQGRSCDRAPPYHQATPGPAGYSLSQIGYLGRTKAEPQADATAPSWREVTFSGSEPVPRRPRLFHSEALEGWMTTSSPAGRPAGLRRRAPG